MSSAMTTAASTPSPALAAGEFLQHMASMQAYYTPGGAGALTPGVSYRLPSPILALAELHPELRAATLPMQAAALVAPKLKPVDRPMAPVATSNVMLATQRATLAFVQSHQQAISKALEAAKGQSSTAQFVLQMQMLEQRELVEHAARIDAMFRGLIAAGHAHPPLQPQILVATNHVSGFLATLLAGSHALLHDVVKGVGGAAHAAEGAVQTAAQAVGHWAAGAAASVGSFFKSIF